MVLPIPASSRRGCARRITRPDSFRGHPRRGMTQPPKGGLGGCVMLSWTTDGSRVAVALATGQARFSLRSEEPRHAGRRLFFDPHVHRAVDAEEVKWSYATSAATRPERAVKTERSAAVLPLGAVPGSPAGKVAGGPLVGIRRRGDRCRRLNRPAEPLDALTGLAARKSGLRALSAMSVPRPVLQSNAPQSDLSAGSCRCALLASGGKVRPITQVSIGLPTGQAACSDSVTPSSSKRNARLSARR
jgi:hypothetical protein